MAVVGRIHQLRHQKDCFDRDYRRLPPEVKVLAEKKLQDLLKHPRPEDCGVGVTKVAGYSGDILTLDVPGGYRISFHLISMHESTEIGGHEPLTAKINIAVLRRVRKYEHLDANP